MLAALRLIHPAPAAAVVALSAALGAILAGQAGLPIDERWAFTVLAVAGSQVFTGATTYTCLLFLDKAGSGPWPTAKIMFDRMPRARLSSETKGNVSYLASHYG